MELGLKDEDEFLDDEPPPILYTYPLDYALSTWWDHRKNGTWPEGTCYNDQDGLLIAMWDSLTARYNWHFRQEERAKREGEDMGRLMKDAGGKRPLADLFGS